MSMLTKPSQIPFIKTLHYIWLNSGCVPLWLIWFASLMFLSVLILQQFFGTNRLWVMDIVTVQCRFHCPSSVCYRHLRPVCVRTNTWSISATLCTWPEKKNVFFTKTAFWLWVGNALYHSIVSLVAHHALSSLTWSPRFCLDSQLSCSEVTCRRRLAMILAIGSGELHYIWPCSLRFSARLLWSPSKQTTCIQMHYSNHILAVYGPNILSLLYLGPSSSLCYSFLSIASLPLRSASPPNTSILYLDYGRMPSSISCSSSYQ